MKDLQDIQVGFIGLGRMGSCMANRLLNSGISLKVFDMNQTKIDVMSSNGAESAISPAHTAIDADIILLSLPNTNIVQDVLFGDEGIIQTAKPDSIVIDTSTISPDATRNFSGRLINVGVNLLDVPVSGGSSGAANGTLSAMVGGAINSYHEALPLLKLLASTITYTGESGSGQALKMVNQVVLVGNVMAMSEGILLAKKFGLDLETTLSAIKGGAASSWMISNLAPKVINNDWSPAFTIELQLKDLRIALETADRLGVPLLQTSLIFQLYRSLAAANKDQDGNHSLIQSLYSLIHEEE